MFTHLRLALAYLLAVGLNGAAVGAAVPLPSRYNVAPEEIVVTATRSGIPVWRVKGPGSTLVLVGAIDGVAKGTRWDPESLTQALVKADRIIFPEAFGLTASPFALIGYVAKWRKQASLPKGQSLALMMRPDQFARLVALRDRGVIKPGFERRHPYHLAWALRNAAKGAGYAPSAGQYVRQTARKHKLNLVRTPPNNAKKIANDFFQSSPQSHLPCLMDAVRLVESGPAAVKARSDAWAARRVAQVLDSPADGVFRRCWPANLAPANALGGVVQRVLLERPTTVAVVSLDSLALPGGLLDDLKAAGYQVLGPAWRR